MILSVYLSLAIFFGEGIIQSTSFSSSTPSRSLQRPPSRYLSFQTPPGLTSNFCDKTKVNNETPDAHEACYKACMDVKKSINVFYSLYPDYKTTKFLQGKCGTVDTGKCAYFHRAAYYPICFCHTSYGLNKCRKTPLFLCHFGIPFLRAITNLGITLAPCATGYEKKVSERVETGNIRQEKEEQKDGSDGHLLVVDLELADSKIQALVDTGSGDTFILPELAGNILPLDVDVTISGISDKPLQMLGKTTIHVQIQKGVIIAVTGIVSNINIDTDLLLGNTFFVEYMAKIKISEGMMTLSIDRTKVDVPIRFRDVTRPGKISALTSVPGIYSSLKIIADLNEIKTKVTIDTGATNCVIRRDFVNYENVSPFSIQVPALGGVRLGFNGKTTFELMVEGQLFRGRTLVPEFQLHHSLLLGNDWNKHFIELIDYEKETVTLKYPGTDNRVTTQAFLLD